MDLRVSEHEKKREIVALTASRWPRAWAEAASSLLGRSREEIRADIRHGDKFKAADARIRGKALARVEALLEADPANQVKLPPLDDSDEGSFDHAVVELQKILCPRGWREKVLPFFTGESEKAFAAYNEAGSEEELYLYRELCGLIERFEQCDMDGQAAAERLNRAMREAV